MSSVKEQLTILVNLQETEDQIQKIETELAVVDERIRSLVQDVTDFSDKVNASKAQHDELKKQYRNDEGEVKRLEAQIVRSHEKLRSVKTNKEYQSMLKEIDELKKQQSVIEDQMINALDQIEAVEKEIVVLEADLKDLTAEVDGKREDIQNNAQAQRDALKTMASKRDGIGTSLNDKIATFFDKVKQKNGGVGVAGVVDEVCQVCRMNIPPQLFIDLMRMNSILMCPHCQRIIYPQALIEEPNDNGGDPS